MLLFIKKPHSRSNSFFFNIYRQLRRFSLVLLSLPSFLPIVYNRGCKGRCLIVDSIRGVGPIEMNPVVPNSNKKSEVQNKQFIEKFQNIKSEQVREHLEKLFTQITAQSEKINEKLHISEVIRYKSLVKDFLDVAVKNSHQFSKQNFLDRRGRHRVYSIVKSVDRELEAITKEFLNKEVDRLSVVKRLDDIRGMLLDVFM